MHSPSVVVFCQKPANLPGSPLSRWLAPTPGQNCLGTIWRDVPSSATMLTRSTAYVELPFPLRKTRKVVKQLFSFGRYPVQEEGKREPDNK